MSDAQKLASELAELSTRLATLAGRVEALESIEADQPAGPAQLLDARAVARLLSVPRKRLYEMHESGELRGVRVGARSLRWSARALELWMRERSRDP